MLAGRISLELTSKVRAPRPRGHIPGAPLEAVGMLAGRPKVGLGRPSWGARTRRLSVGCPLQEGGKGSRQISPTWKSSNQRLSCFYSPSRHRGIGLSKGRQGRESGHGLPAAGAFPDISRVFYRSLEFRYDFARCNHRLPARRETGIDHQVDDHFFDLLRSGS